MVTEDNLSRDVLETEPRAAETQQQDPVPSMAEALAPMGVPSWLEQDEQLRDMWLAGINPQEISEKLGRSVAAIMTRAVRLGLPRRAAPGRKPGYRRMDSSAGGAQTGGRRVSEGVAALAQQVDSVHDAMRRAPQPATRVCLMCLNKFMSQGSHNRICPTCKGTAQYAAACSLPDMNYKVET